jgi:hydroxymethylbilane synthase
MAVRPDLEVVELRGNVPTRIRKVEEGQVHAAVLAAAGIHRLAAHQSIRCYLDPPGWLPAAGQGVIAVQARRDYVELVDLLAGLHHKPSALAASAERAFLQAMDGGCQVPVGALLMDVEGGRELHGFIGDERGSVVRGSLPLDPADAEKTGRLLAVDVRSRGGDELVRRLREVASRLAPQPE